jgi:type VI secretion system ImpC/EvpB family protein
MCPPEQPEFVAVSSSAGSRSAETVSILPASRPAGPEAVSAVEWALGTSVGAAAGGSRSADRLLAARGPAEALAAWASTRVAAGERITRGSLAERLGVDIASLDAAIGRQLDAILHHPRFQQLEASWRSLAWLVNRADEAASAEAAGDGQSRVQVRILSASKRDLARDLAGAVEFDRTAVWRKVYEDEFGTAGGMPYGLLVADYAFGKHPDDIDLLAGLAEIAAASFAPLIAAPQPDLLGIDSLHDLEEAPALDSLHAGVEYTKWRSLRGREESRFVGLALPRVLARLPYDGWVGAVDAAGEPERTWARRGFRYREEADGPDGGRRLWTSAAWAFAGVVVAEFGRSGWFSDIRGGSRGSAGGGLVAGLPVEAFGASEPFAFRRGPTETLVTEATERRLAAAGFIPLAAAGADGRAVFHSNQSLHAARRYDRAEATANARISAMLQYMLCVSRFAHYLKVMARDKVGSVATADELEHALNEWIHDYVTPDDRASAETRARLPLRAAQVEVRDEPGSAGGYRVLMHLQPHFQLDELAAAVRLTTTVRKK